MEDEEDQVVESVYTVTITNGGDERAIGRRELESIIRDFIRKYHGSMDGVVVHVESH